jgi:hypothetical protein
VHKVGKEESLARVDAAVERVAVVSVGHKLGRAAGVVAGGEARSTGLGGTVVVPFLHKIERTIVRNLIELILPFFFCTIYVAFLSCGKIWLICVVHI